MTSVVSAWKGGEATMSSFDKKVAVVTGGGAGIGEALSRDLGRRGAVVVVADMDKEAAERVARDIIRDGGQARAHPVDVSNEPDVAHLVEGVAGEHGRLDYLFNNAGIAIAGDARDLTLAHWRRVLDVDLYGVLYGTLAAYPIMVAQGFGQIVNTSSATGLFPQPMNAPYCTAKHAVVGLSMSLRLEGADLGVKVNVVCPGYVHTAIATSTMFVNMPSTYKPIHLVEPSHAARVILRGVGRNDAVIVFPPLIRWTWRAYRLFPAALNSIFLRRIRPLRASRVDGSR
jgi:NAD(P)-dependent dehydrogenase (short-subunit alcohol dehydrogenase family)